MDLLKVDLGGRERDSRPFGLWENSDIKLYLKRLNLKTNSEINVLCKKRVKKKKHPL